jgi:precorrin-6Y C5,15-methyltransferase (decarboxylating)
VSEPARIDVVGIGADGWDGLGPAARAAVASAQVLMGSSRQLALTPPSAARRVSWPSPLLPALADLLAAHEGSRICVLASGDPMFHGIGVTLARLLGPRRLRVFPQPSSASLACARLGWPLADTPVLSVVARPLETILPALADGARLLLLSRDGHTPELVAALLCENGFGASALTVLEQLGGPAEAVYAGIARGWSHPPADPLNVLAVDCVADPDVLRLTRIPGLPDEAFGGVGQFTKTEVRALTLSALAPAPGELLWDVGGGSGSIAIEWCRTDPACRAVSFEHLPARAEAIAENARRLGVPGIVVAGRAPEAFADAPSPDAIFVGGGVTQPGLLDECWQRLPSGGRMVVNAVTAEGESVLVGWYSTRGGTLRRAHVERAEALGSMTIWRPKSPVTQWIGGK